jgi:predicted alpha/beta-fold hydrolase
MNNIKKQLYRLVGAILVGAYLERHFRRNTDRVVYCPPPTIDSKDPRSPLAFHIANILKARPSLRFPNYQPPFWVFNSWINIVVFVIKQKWSTYWYRTLLTREYITTATTATTATTNDSTQGGAICDSNRLSIDSLSNCEDEKKLPSSAPLLLILPTITGSGTTHTYLMRLAIQRGWRPVCLNRRGLADKLDTPTFNVMGNQHDTLIQVQHVLEKYKNTKFVGMVGLSAGSGELINYLGTSGSECGVNAACCLCPAYDIDHAFENFHKQYPLVDRLLLRDVKRKYIHDNVDMLRQSNAMAVEACTHAASIHEFIQAHVPFTGAANRQQYMARSNPMNHVFGIRCPVMILNSEDDMICLPENIRDDLALEYGGVLLLRTSEGSHIAYSEGWNGAGNYLVRTSLDFLEGAMEVNAKVEEF